MPERSNTSSRICPLPLRHCPRLQRWSAIGPMSNASAAGISLLPLRGGQETDESRAGLQKNHGHPKRRAPASQDGVVAGKVATAAASSSSLAAADLSRPAPRAGRGRVHANPFRRSTSTFPDRAAPSRCADAQCHEPRRMHATRRTACSARKSDRRRRPDPSVASSLDKLP